MLASLVEMLSAAEFICVAFSSPVNFLRALPTLPPSCVITDVRMDRISGLTLIERLKGLGYGDWPVIVISGYADVPMTVSAMRLGAVTVLEKPILPRELIAAIEEASIRTRPNRAPDPEFASAQARYSTLSKREREVLASIVAGKRTKATASELGLSLRSVEAVRASILRKMQARSFASLGRQIGEGLGEPF